MKKVLSLVLALVLVLGVAAAASADGMYISVISKGEQHAFWQAVRKGCEDAAAKYGVEMYYYGPPTEADIALQVEALKGEMAKKPAAIALAALSTESVMGELQECVAQNIPVIGFDSGVPDAPEGAIRSTVATNNENAAALAAEKFMEIEAFKAALTAATPEKPMTIACLSQDATSMSVSYRTTGFVNKMKELAGAIGTVSVQGHALWADATPVENPSIIIHVEVGATANDSDLVNAANAVLNKDGLLAVFCSNEGTARAMLSATADGSELGDGGRFADLIVAGFDAGITQKNAVRNQWFVGAVTQDPYNIGFKSVEMAFKAASGEAVEDVDTGAKWYTYENIDDPDIALLVYD
ncbi:MAG: substrate-binding domain-containing protein [Clostridia bacterium]